MASIFGRSEIFIFVLPGFKGNEWTANSLQKKGYEFSYSVKANNKKSALELTKNE